MSEKNNATEFYPTETKLFNGVLYSVDVARNTSRFIVLVGEGSAAVREEVECKDVTPENYGELFARGHAHAEKIIQTNNPRNLGE